MNKQRISLIAVTIIFLFFKTDLAHAQSVDLQNAKNAYVIQADTYRSVESAFVRAKEQYIQIKTLASMEEAIKASKLAQESRIETLKSFFNALYLTVSETKGLEIQTKEQQLQNIQATLDLLEKQKIELQKANDKLSLDKVTKDFEADQSKYNQTTYSALTFVRIARVQSALDQLGLAAQTVYDDFQNKQLDATQAATKQRAYDELVRLIVRLKEDMLKIRTNESQRTIQGAQLSSYTDVLGNLSNVYAGLRRGYNFVTELNQ